MLDRDAVLAEMSAIEWSFAPNETSGAVQEMAERIARTGRLAASLISYSNLVSGIPFSFTNVQNGTPFVIDVRHWEGLHRRIVGDCLGYISYISYRDYDFMASSLVAGLVSNKPSDLFFDWMQRLGAIKDLRDDSIDRFWIDQVNRSVAWYKKHPSGFAQAEMHRYANNMADRACHVVSFAPKFGLT